MLFQHGYALIVGVGRSAYPAWSLPTTAGDAAALRAALTDPTLCAYPADDDHVRVLCDETATRAALRDGLAWLAQQAAADDDATALVYISGHGWVDKTTGGYYLLPHDVKPFDVPGSALAGEDFAAALRAIDAQRLLVFLDSCHAAGMARAKDAATLELPGQFRQAALPKGLADALKEGQGRAVFASSRGEQRSWLRPDRTLSLYTHHLLEALHGAGSRPGDEVVRLSHLAGHLSRTVPDSAQRLCAAEQTPFYDWSSEDFPVALLRGGKGLPAEGWQAGEALAQPGSGPTYKATLHGSGAIAQDHSVAAGAGGTAIGTVEGSAVAVGPSARAVKAEVYVENLENLPDPEAMRRNEARERYLRRLRQRCNVLPLAAVGGDEDAGEEVTLDKVYVVLDTETRVPVDGDDKSRNRSRGAPDVDALGRGREERPLTALEAATQHRWLVLLGEPGSGKSTFVRQLAAWLAAASLGEDSPPAGWRSATLPLLVSLRDLAPALDALALDGVSEKERNRRLVAAVREHWQGELRELQAEAFAPGLEQALDTGSVLLIFDGLDEVPEKLRPRVRQAVQAAANAFAAVEHVMVTSRIRSYASKGAALPNFAVHTLAPFDPDKIRSFVARWYEAQVALDRMTEDKAKENIDDLQREALKDELRELASNPMLLTTMAIVHQKEVRLPKQRVQLYAKAVEVLLTRWQKRKNIPMSTELRKLLGDELKMRAIMELLAYQAQQVQARSKQRRPAEEGVLDRGSLITLLDQPRFLGDTALAAEFLDYVDKRAGLLVGHGGGEEGYPQTYSFPHRTFQEYLAGCQMIEGRDVARKYREHAAEGDFWGLAALLGAEELLYNRRVPEYLLDLAYKLCPVAEPAKPGEWRALLWSGQMAALVTRPVVAEDAGGPDDGQAYLDRLIPRLLAIMRSSPLGPIERAEAGKALARLGDLRIEVLDPLHVEFLDVPAGPFRMGNDDKAKAFLGDESPQHTYNLAYGYKISRYPITNAQFDVFAQAGGYTAPNYWKEASSRGYWRPGEVRRRWYDGNRRVEEWASAPADYGEPFSLANHPVVGVNWWEALAFTRWLTEQLQAAGRLPVGWQVHLPSEAEWEKAARGDDGRDFPWPGKIEPNRANYGASGIGAINAVGCFPGGASPCGAEEMAGNVWEWTRSLYAKYPYPAGGKRLLERENLAADVDDSRVLRGGSFGNNFVYDLRCAARVDDVPDLRVVDIGFRVCASPLPLASVPL